MAGFITLLLAVIAQFGGSSTDPKELAAELSRALFKAQPVPMESVDATCELANGGGFDSIEFSIEGLELDPLVIEHAVIRVEGVEILGNGKVQLDAVGFEVEITDADLSKALAQHTKAITGAVITSSKSGIQVEGNYPLWKMEIPFSLEGQLVVKQQTHLVFELESSGVGSIRIPEQLNRLLEQEINPVYDLAQFSTRSKKEIEKAKQQLDYKFYLLIKKITPGKGKITVAGSA